MPYRIIVADKDPISLPTVSNMFENEDLQFSGVASAGELKKTIKTSAPDLIILNSLLSDTPNWQSVQKIVSGIRASRDFAAVRILVMSGDSGSPRSTELNVVGVDGCIDKPIDGSVLRHAVQSLLGISNTSHLEEDDEDITLEFENDWAAVDEPGASGESGLEPQAESNSHVLNLPHADALSSANGTQFHDVDIPADDGNGIYELSKEESGVERFQDASSWLDTFHEPLSREPLDTMGKTTEDSTLADLEFVPGAYDSATSENIVPPELPATDELDVGDFETHRIPDLDSGSVSSPTGHMSPHLPAPASLDDQRRAEILSQTRSILCEALPSRDEISAILEKHVASLMPSKDELTATLEAAIERVVHREFRTLDSISKKKTFRQGEINLDGDEEDLPPDGSTDLEPITGADLIPDRFVSAEPLRGSADDVSLEKYLKGAVPGRDEIAELINASIAHVIVEAVERVVREQIEKITSDLSS